MSEMRFLELKNRLTKMIILNFILDPRHQFEGFRETEDSD